MAERSSVYYFSAVDPTADPNNSWNLKLDTLYSIAQQGRRIKLYDAGEVVFPDTATVRLCNATWPTATVVTPMPNFPVVWPRKTTPELAWDFVADLAWMGTAAASIELGYAEVALGSAKEELRKLAALVTVLRCGAARALNVSCINVWRPSHEMATYHDEKLAILRVSKVAANRTFSQMLDRREKLTLNYAEVAKFGAYFVSLGAMARLSGGRHAMAIGESRFALTRLVELLGSDWNFLTREVYIRDALLSEVWKAFPENVGDVINSDIIGQEVVARCLLTDDDSMAASVLREAEYRASASRTPRRAPQITRTVLKAPAQLDYSPVASESGDTELPSTPVVRYADVAFTPLPKADVELSPIASPDIARPSVLWSPTSRMEMDATMRAQHAKSLDLSPAMMTVAPFGQTTEEPPMLT